MTAPMQEGRQAGTDRRRSRVTAAISAAQREGTPLTASTIARAAAVDRAFLYRHRDLLDTLHPPPLFWTHVNPSGRFELDMNAHLDLAAAAAAQLPGPRSGEPATV
ncbi:hypothetical protein AB0G81_19240 [Streptomyces asoensis]|uniref:hypothetical protein n=1 Tax=Streptomyces asoensis TaxID=249586 RepID=UPI0033C644F3